MAVIFFFLNDREVLVMMWTNWNPRERLLGVSDGGWPPRPPWATVWQFLKRGNTELACGPAVPALGM